MKFERGAVKTAKELGIRAVPAETQFRCDVREVFRWDNASAEMQRVTSVEWRSQEINGRLYVLPAGSPQGLYFEIRSQSSAAAA
jgi:hypothetical protein